MPVSFQSCPSVNLIWEEQQCQRSYFVVIMIMHSHAYILVGLGMSLHVPLLHLWLNTGIIAGWGMFNVFLDNSVLTGRVMFPLVQLRTSPASSSDWLKQIWSERKWNALFPQIHVRDFKIMYFELTSSTGTLLLLRKESWIPLAQKTITFFVVGYQIVW